MRKIKILGTGCGKCNELMNNIMVAIDELNVIADVQKVNDIIEIQHYGITVTPALIIDDKIMSAGKTLSVEKIKEMLSA